MAEIVASVLVPAMGVMKWIGAPIKRQSAYLCCFGSNITNLRNEAEQLVVTAEDLQAKIDRERDYGRIISVRVEVLFANFKRIKDEMDGILKEVTTVKSACLKLGARFSLSKRAMKTTNRSKELREWYKFDVEFISYPGSPASMKTVPLPAIHEFESRKQIEKDIMTTLVGEDVNIIGICGMAGLGKTIMARRIGNKALENNIFNEVVMVVVGQFVDKLKLQLEIGRSLGLKNLEEESSQSRKQKLHERLSGNNRILLILDDVWKNLELEEVGIPCNHKRCTLLITSRNMSVFSQINVQNQDVFVIKQLSDEEVWILFSEKVGIREDDKLNSIAESIAKKCKESPLALTTIAASLKEVTDVEIWKNALWEFEQVERNIPNDQQNVYDSIKLSYDFLQPKHKLVFLLCCLYPEDADIPIEELTYFSMGLGIFEGGIVQEARNWMYSLTKMLKNRSLLLDSHYGDDYVRMHDVIRDIGKFISKQEGHDCNWISASQRSELPTTFPIPNLRLLLIQNQVGEEFHLDSSFLEGNKDLCVLSIQRLSLTSLPHTPKSLESLKTLVLVSCQGLETLSTVGELINLEILICRDCRSIEELPPEMKKLNKVKLLELLRCGKLQRVGGGIISSLIALEELKMLGSFNKWEEGENARLRELEELKMLKCLEIEIEDPATLVAVEMMYLPSRLDRFHIRSPPCEVSFEFNLFRSNKKLKLMCKDELYLGHWIETQLLPHTEVLYLSGGNVNYLSNCEKLRYLELEDCKTIKEIFKTSRIEHLKLSKLQKLENIWDDDRVSLNFFMNLEKLLLNDLPSLKYFGNHCIPQLEVVRIENCEIMEQVFLWKGELQNSHHITKMFPKLKKVELYDLPNLTSFYKGIEDIEFPQLAELIIKRCAKMRSLVWKEMQSNKNNANIHSLSFQEGLCGSLITFGNHVSLTKPTTTQHMNGDQRTLLFPKLENVILEDLRELESFCEWKCEDELPSLREVRIKNCRKMKQVWKRNSSSNANIQQTLHISGHEGSTSVSSSSIARNLCNLTKLRIEDCGEMAHVITDDEKKGMSGGESTLLQFPKLKELTLSCSPKLESFTEWKCDVELPSLMQVKVHGCPNMKNLMTLGSLHAPHLESLDTDMENDLHLRVPFNSMKKLDLSLFKNPLNCYKIDEYHFRGLEELTISGYMGRMSLFPYSIAGYLVQLTALTITSCDEMVKVIDKENVSSCHQRRSLFPELQTMRLSYLPKLVTFCEWKCDVELPLLTKVTIEKCDNMKSYTSGNLDTPNLTSVCVNGTMYDVASNLNGQLQKAYKDERAKNKKR